VECCVWIGRVTKDTPDCQADKIDQCNCNVGCCSFSIPVNWLKPKKKETPIGKWVDDYPGTMSCIDVVGELWLHGSEVEKSDWDQARGFVYEGPAAAVE